MSHEISNVAEAETLGTVESIRAASLCEMPSLRRGRRAPSRPKGARRNLRGLMSGHRLQSRLARIGKMRNRSR